MLRKTDRVSLCAVVVSLMVTVLFPSASAADVMYRYAGNPMEGAFGGSRCPLGGEITGYFSVPTSLQPNLPYGAIVPTSFSFTSGGLTISNSTPGLSSKNFFVATDVNGNVALWGITLIVGPPFTPQVDLVLSTVNNFNGADDLCVVDMGPGGVDAQNTINIGFPGKWSSGCGDDRDTIIQEYVDRNVVDKSVSPSTPFRPSCTDFTDKAPLALQSPSSMWAIVQAPLLNGLAQTSANYHQSLSIVPNGGGYRTPTDEYLISLAHGYTYPNGSFHQLGLAADIVSNALTWGLIKAAAKAAVPAACVEPEVFKGHYSPNHVHVDWPSGPCDIPHGPGW